MKRKLFSAVLGGVLTLTCLAGCGQSSDSAQTSSVAEGEIKNELPFVNYRDIRDLNPHLYAGEMYACLLYTSVHFENKFVSIVRRRG